MPDSFNRLAKILRVQPETLLDLEQKMAIITGKTGVIEKIVQENDLLIDRTLSEVGLTRKSSAQEIRQAFQARLAHLDNQLYEILDKPDLSKMSGVCTKLCEVSIGLVNLKTGFFIKMERAVELLEKYPPQNLLDFFGYKSVRELIDKESFESVFAALRFTQTTDWMHKFFDEVYNDLKPEDFEEREIQLKVLEEKWFRFALRKAQLANRGSSTKSGLNVAEKFLEKKYHNVSHLKELGIIFIVPLKLDTPGEVLRIFTLLLHYLNEVPFYSKLFKRFSKEPDFIEKLKSLLRGDVLDVSKVQNLKPNAKWLIIQRYLAKDNENDQRLFMPHVNPEAEHWYKAEESLGKLGPSFLWKELDFVGDFFGEELVSFDLIDLVMTLVKKGEIKYLYHQEEALWNKIFIEYLGREK
ncbi:MAG: hypothetical protein AAB627_00115, partial [Patescibacteria group bacterium]